MAGGTSNEHYGAWQNWLVAIIVLCIVTYLNHYGKGIFKLASILIGIIIGYVISIFFGMVDFSSVIGASLISIPQPLHFGIKFEPLFSQESTDPVYCAISLVARSRNF